MNAVRKLILFLGAVAILFGAPLTAAVENDDIQTPAAVILSAPAAISPSARGAARARVLLAGTVVVAPCPVSFSHVVASLSHAGSNNCRSNLRSLCLLRC